VKLGHAVRDPRKPQDRHRHREWIAADHFELDATLGFLLGAFSKTIEAEIERNLDDLLAAEGQRKSAAKKAAGKKSPKK